MKTKNVFEPVIITSRTGMIATGNEAVKARLAIAALTIEMEQGIAEVQKKFQRQLDPLLRTVATCEAGIAVWCQANRATEFTEKKSIDLTLFTVGFRDTPHSVEKCRAKDTWTDAALRLAAYRETKDIVDGEGNVTGQELVFDGSDYVGYADPKLAKDKLLADRAKIPAAALKAAGIYFEKDEVFYITPKSEVIEGSSKEVAA